ncbi:hypothetical protein R1sor_000535 [Riccia sorocarpa]|uniref:Uncharacterized protein n=1 Tax=Riccia sorocarpa TaxID=122646 RepID=A0ABD3GTN3_9MARC
MKHVESIFATMQDNPRAVRLGLATDGLELEEIAKSSLNKIHVLVELSYYNSLLIQNLRDPMHQEGNMAKNLLLHIFGHMDEVRHQKACEEFNVHEDAWVYYRADGSEGKRRTPWILSKAERDTFYQRLFEIRTPASYSCYIGATFKPKMTRSGEKD